MPQGKMRAILKSKADRGVSFGEVEIPKIRDHEVLVKVKATSICGTDLHIYSWDKWSQSRIKPPLVIGHEFAGEIVEKGKLVKGLEIGDSVSAETHIACGYCYQCKTGNEHICQNLTILGVDVNGTFAQYVALPQRNAWKNDKKLSWEIASIQEPLGNAVQTVFAGGGPSSKTVLIYGLGPIGLMSIELCKALGASKIIAVDISDYRLKLASKFKPDHLLNGKEGDPHKKIMDLTNGTGVDVMLEMSGSPVAFKEGLKVVKTAGFVSLLGIPRDVIEFDIANSVIMKGINLYGIAGRKMYETWYQMKGLLDSGKIDVSPVITHRMKLEDFEKGIELMSEGLCGKIVMTL